jgi:hypothetical protein
MACTMWCFYGLPMRLTCLSETSMLASMLYLKAPLRGLSLLGTNSLIYCHWLQVANPFAHQSDSFYFVDDKLVMQNKAFYAYDQ